MFLQPYTAHQMFEGFAQRTRIIYRRQFKILLLKSNNTFQQFQLPRGEGGDRQDLQFHSLCFEIDSKPESTVVGGAVANLPIACSSRGLFEALGFLLLSSIFIHILCISFLRPMDFVVAFYIFCSYSFNSFEAHGFLLLSSIFYSYSLNSFEAHGF